LATILPRDSAVLFELTKISEVRIKAEHAEDTPLISTKELVFLQRTIELYSNAGSCCRRVVKIVKRIFDAIQHLFCCNSKWLRAVTILGRVQSSITLFLEDVETEYKSRSDASEVLTSRKLHKNLEIEEDVRFKRNATVGVRQFRAYVSLNKRHVKNDDYKRAYQIIGDPQPIDFIALIMNRMLLNQLEDAPLDDGSVVKCPQRFNFCVQADGP